MFRALCLALLAWTVSTAHAAESAPFTSTHATVTLVSETDGIEAGKPFRLGLHFKLAPGWHIYWSNPGDAGQPPEMTLALPDSSFAGGFVWPTPVRITEGPVMTYAYLGDVLLPLTVTPGAIGASFPIDAKANWLICAKLCVPEQASFHLDLAAGQPTKSAEAPLFAATDARVPRASPFAATISETGTLALRGDGISAASVADAWFFPSAGGQIDQLAAQKLTVGDNVLTLSLALDPAYDHTKTLAGTVVLKDRSGAESDLTIDARPGAAPAMAEASSLAQLLLFAFLGGLILNLMPCVFPILAMKALAIARLSGAERALVRTHALTYTAGVLVAFGAFAALLLALRVGGSAIGWGFQFQSPIFVALMAWLLFGVGLNLSGVFVFGGQIGGIGQNLTDHGGHVGSFFTGLLAVLVATPCTAPFMGAAVASALTAPPAETLAIFLMLGLGLAAPYALLAVTPGLASLLPRPGRWMDILKQVLAFPMYAAVVWLVWVLSQQAGSDGVLWVTVGLLALGFAAWAYGVGQSMEGVGKRVSQLAVAVTLIAVAAMLPALNGATAAAPSASASTDSEPYSAKRLAALRADGKPVFVNMTASWCVTCLVNERVALSPEAVRQAFVDHHVTYLKGDWTRQDPAITDFLRAHERDGVPLYVFYPAGDGPPKILPQILTQAAILDEVNKAGS